MEIIFFEKAPIISIALRKVMKPFSKSNNVFFLSNIVDLKETLNNNDKKIIIMDLTNDSNMLLKENDNSNLKSISFIFYNDNYLNLKSENYHFLGKSASLEKIYEKVDELIK